MTENTQNNPIKEASPVAKTAPVSSSVSAGAPVSNQPFKRNDFRGGDRRGSSGQGGRRGGGGRRPGRDPRVKPEFDNKIINIRRVARVAAGGRRFNFSVAIICGNRKGTVGVGIGKGADTALAIDKATRNAKKNMFAINLTKEMSISHEVSAKYSSARVVIRPAKGRGVVAGSAVRDVIVLTGIKDVGGKIVSPSKNKLNVARATVEALRTLTPVKEKVSVTKKEAVKTK